MPKRKKKAKYVIDESYNLGDERTGIPLSAFRCEEEYSNNTSSIDDFVSEFHDLKPEDLYNEMMPIKMLPSSNNLEKIRNTEPDDVQTIIRLMKEAGIDKDDFIDPFKPREQIVQKEIQQDLHSSEISCLGKIDKHYCGQSTSRPEENTFDHIVLEQVKQLAKNHNEETMKLTQIQKQNNAIFDRDRLMAAFKQMVNFDSFLELLQLKFVVNLLTLIPFFVISES